MPKVKNKKQKYLPYAKGFRLPSNKETVEAMGEGPVSKSLDPGNNAEFFSPVPLCTSIDDWLAQYNEEGQTYAQFLEQCPWLSTCKRKSVKQTFVGSGKTLGEKYPDGKIYLVPVGEFSTETSPHFEALEAYTKVFLGIPVQILPPVKLRFEDNQVFWEPNQIKVESPQNIRSSNRSTKFKLNSRFNENSRKYQLCIDTILRHLREMIHDDALCLIGLTMSDLYCDPSDLFVAGMAAGNHRVAIFSFARYDPNLTFSPEFWYEVQQNDFTDDTERKKMILLRSCKLLVHEICHLLGIDHCIFYSCSMNGSGRCILICFERCIISAIKQFY